MTAGLLLMKNVLTPFTKSILIPLGLKNHGARTTAVIISNEEMEDMKIVKSVEESGLPMKGIIKKNKNETKEQKARFFPMILGTFAASMCVRVFTG